MIPQKYIKPERSERGHKQTGVSIEFYQHKILKDEKINLSLLMRDLLDQYFEANFPDKLKNAKQLQLIKGEENEE